MKLFTCGPVQMYPSVETVRANEIIYFRTSEYGNMVKSVLSGLNRMIHNSLAESLIYLASSGTGAMEAVVENCISPNDKALVINGGAFGRRFCELLKYHDVPFESINLNWNETLTSEHFSSYQNKNFTHLFVNIHETHTGQLYDIEIISNFCRKNNLFLIVDAISSFLADKYDMEKYGTDATIISSQKGLCCSPGMSFVSFSKKMTEKIINSSKSKTMYFNFKDYLINIKRGQTPYTPPVCVMYEIEEMLKLIENAGGIEVWLENIKQKALYFRHKAIELGLKIPQYPISNMLTPIEFNNISAYKIFQILKDKYQIYVNPCGGDLSNRLLRISHIGNTNFDDIDYLINCIKFAVNEIS